MKIFKRLKKAFNIKYKEDSMTKEQVKKAIESLSPDERAEILKGFEPEKVEEIAEVKEELPVDEPKSEESEIKEEVKEEVKEAVAAEPKQEDFDAKIAVALAPLMVQLKQMSDKIDGMTQEPQKAPMTQQEKLNKLAAIYGN